MKEPEPNNLPANSLFLGLGSNINPDQNLPAALHELKQYGTIASVSSIWKSPAVGSSGPDFLNMVIRYITPISHEELKTKIIRMIETKLGRLRSPDKNAPRPIDIDILIVNDRVVDPEIWRLPHVAIPLSEIYPNLQHPTSTVPLIEIAHTFLGSYNIKKWPDDQATHSRGI